MAVIKNKKKIEEVLMRGVERIYPSSDALKKALSKKIRIYHGVDPTGAHLHLGHLTNLLTLKKFQELGHEIIFLIGDFTARIGDPTDKGSTRQPLTEKQIKTNLKTFKKQVGKILPLTGRNAVKFRFNSKWLSKLNFKDLIKLAHNFTVQQMIQRDMFQERLKKSKPIGLHEFFYPLMQGYDSVAMDVDLELGGNDQTFNMLIGRDLVKIYKNKQKFVITTKLLVNPKTGVKLMNKSEGGMINLDDSSKNMYGKVMALDDDAIIPVAEFSSEMPMNKVKELKKMVKSDPKKAKMKVARAVIETIYTKKEAQNAEQEFVKVFVKKERPTEIPILDLNKNKIVDAHKNEIKKMGGIGLKFVLVCEPFLIASFGKASKLIAQNGVKVNGRVAKNPKMKIKSGDIIKVGKKRIFKIKYKI